jgi:N-acetylglucosaminyl-diphospho-decaprenol L-rhamnosyltransferase
MDLSLIIVNYNGGGLLDTCIGTIYENPPAGEFEVILIDNASTDGSFDRVRARFPQLICQANEGNVGLSLAFNDGLRLARGRYLMSLDNDTRILPGAFDELLREMEADPGIGIAGSMLHNPDMTLQRTFRRKPSWLNAIFGRRSLITAIWPNNPLSSKYLMNEQVSNDEPFEVDWVSTAALAISRRAYETAGGLDEDFFVYWVDADWCARTKAAGFRIIAVPASHIIHDENLKARRGARKSSRMIKDFHRGAYLYYRKNHARWRFHPMALVAWVGLNLRAQLMIFSDYLRCQLANLSPKSKEAKHDVS